MSLYNIATCSGFDAGTAAGFITTGACMKGRLCFVLLFFIIAILRKWGGEEMGIAFSFVGSLALGLIPYLLIITILGSFKIALVAGLIGALVGGYLGGAFLGGEE